MRSMFVFLLCLFVSNAAWSKDIKIVGQEFMPVHGSTADGKPDGGAHAEAMKRVCAKLKWNCKFEVVPLARVISMLTNGEAHFGMGLAKNAEREAIANFPNMVSQLGYTFFVKKGEAAKLTKLDDFKGKTVGVHGGSATGKDLAEQNGKIGGAMKIVEESTAETAPKKLAGGRYGDGAAIYCARPVCVLQSQRENLAIEPVGFDAKLQSHSIIASKKAVNAADFEAYKKALAEVLKGDDIKKIFADANLTVHPDNK